MYPKVTTQVKSTRATVGIHLPEVLSLPTWSSQFSSPNIPLWGSSVIDVSLMIFVPSENDNRVPSSDLDDKQRENYTP